VGRVAVRRFQYLEAIDNNQTPTESFPDLVDTASISLYQDFLDGYDPTAANKGKTVESPTFNIHFDGRVPGDDNYNIHVVIPDLDEKVIRQNLIDDPKFDLDGVAVEAMGFIVIMGCHS